VGEPYFDRMTTPIGIALLFLMAVAPALPWRATTAEVLRNRLLVPAWIGAITMVAAIVLGAGGITEVVAFGLAAFALAGIVRQFVVGARSRRAAHGESRVRALVGAVRSNPRLYGGLVVHTGIVVIAIALVASSTYSTRHEVRLVKGESATVEGYRLTYLGIVTTRDGQNAEVKARLRLTHNGDDLGVYSPAIKSFPNFNGGIGTPDIRSGPFRDVYLTLISSPNEGKRVTIAVAIKPLVSWLWIGGGIVALGTLMALLPSLRRRRVGISREPPPEPRTADRDPEPVPA
jgi:cytochrome c-type biogenesis protein CcmF